MALDVDALRAAVRAADADGWLFFDFRRSNTVAHRVLGLSPHAFFTRRWLYYVPAAGEPTKLVSAVEAHVLDDLPGRKRVYQSWTGYREQLGALLDGARRVLMEYVPQNAIPYLSLVDAGTVELVRALGPEVASSAEVAQRFEAVLTPAQLAAHRQAGAALMRAWEALVAWLGERVRAGGALSEYDAQQRLRAAMRDEGLLVPADDPPLVAVNGNAANPHYAPSATRHAPIAEGDLLLVDFSAKLPEEDAVFADYTRMLFIGHEVPRRASEPFAVLVRARDAGIALLGERFTGGARVEGWEVDEVVRQVIGEAGYGDAFVHRTGHNIGTAIHGNGAHLDNLETHEARPLLPNTCTSVEPGIYLPDQGIGLRTEVDVLLLPGGIEVTGEPRQMAIPALL